MTRGKLLRRDIECVRRLVTLRRVCLIQSIRRVSESVLLLEKAPDGRELSAREVAARCIREAEAVAAKEGSVAGISLTAATAQSLAAQVGDKEKQVRAREGALMLL